MIKENIKFIAHFVVETNTPLAIGSGEKGLTVDRLIAKDANGLPYIPGTSLAGVVRHTLKESGLETDELFGYQDGNNGQGSRINFSSAILLADDGETVLEGLRDIDFQEGYYAYFNRLPQRDHVRITDKGTADTEGHGKFDEELVHKGARFVFEIELDGTVKDEDSWNKILNVLNHPSFRIGSGTRKGFGQLKIIECKTIEINLNDDIKEYLSVESSLNKDIGDWVKFKAEKNDSDFIHYKVNLEPENFYQFGAGIGDGDVDMAPKTERFFDWSTGKPVLTEDKILIPATSVKGAISHRVAYWHNNLSGISIDKNIYSFESVEVKNVLNTITLYNELLSQFKAKKTEMDEVSIQTDNAEETKEKLESLKSELISLKKKLNELDAEKLVENSEGWSDYTKDMERQKDLLKTKTPNVSELNNAVRYLFGFAKDSKNEAGNEKGEKGKVIISDVYLDKKQDHVQSKIFDHVAIDRFTGGGLNGALYQEKVVSSNSFILDIYLKKKSLNDNMIKKAFLNSLDDLVSGRLLLGGNTGKGHGAFKGNYELVK